MKNALLFALLTAGCASAPAAAQEKGLEIYWVDVEGGAATLVVTPEGESLMMDTGWPGKRDPERIRKVAGLAGVKKIDHLLISHWHTDHWGGVAGLAEIMPVGRYYDHGFPEGNPRDVDAKLKDAYLAASGGKSVVLKPGDTVPLKGASVKILASHGIVLGEAPGSPQTRPCTAHSPLPDDASDNARSLGWVLEYKGFKFLNLGDLTWNVEHKLVCPKDLIGPVDVYQMTHHGLDISNHPAVLQAASPTVVVINNGPKKGGTAKAFARLKDLAGLKDVWQGHRNVQTPPADNAPPEFVANDGEACKGEHIKLSVHPSGKSYAVEIPSKGTRREYRTK